MDRNSIFIAEIQCVGVLVASLWLVLCSLDEDHTWVRLISHFDNIVLRYIREWFTQITISY
ncbi:hypothetical protein CPB86DRAFT_74900 [Serendipita vermifera]|nr:hypothetical protein CPB86DRAFT_74900 [Serendipita vermifera]